jgi:hypothetical protein
MEFCNMYNKKMYKIYILERNGIPFYIGKAKNAIRRYHGHRRTFGLDIEFNVIDEVEDWKFWESYWIEQFKCWGFILENKNNGGGGPSSYTEEQKKKMRGPRPGTGEKISKTLRERNHSQYYTDKIREKISNSLKGKPKPFSDDHKKAMGIAKRKNAKPVLQYDLDGNFIKEWESKGQAAQYLKEETKRTSNLMSQIKDCILGRQKTCWGYIWKYK